MKKPVERRSPKGLIDHLALGLTTFGVGYIPGAPGTYGSAVAIAIYVAISWVETSASGHGRVGIDGFHWAINGIMLAGFCLVGIAASTRSIPLLGSGDPSEAVVDEVMGQLVTLCFVPMGIGWPFILAGFLLFRLFDIVKPFPVRTLEVLPGGLGICADDIVAGVYAGICLAAGYAIYLVV